jgi:ATP-dependent phosphofructokinase / diphosphate-dependent phosphofructokinase
MPTHKRVGILFSGGPAPAANAVISATAISFIENGWEVYGIFHGYSNLCHHSSETPVTLDQHYRKLTEEDVRGLRNSRGIVIGTARANPGQGIQRPADLSDPTKTATLSRVYQGLVAMGIDALVSIGGDDTLKTANFIKKYQEGLPDDHTHIHIVHVPKTIDNDYNGIDFTFGFFTAVDVMAKEVQNLRADAIATSAYYIVETMGRKAGWLSYGVAIAGEATLVLGVEDLEPFLEAEADGTKALSLDKLCGTLVDVIVARERQGKHHGVIVLAEGLAEYLPQTFLEGIGRDAHGHISLGKLDVAKLMATLVGDAYRARQGTNKKLTGVQLGYESRCAPPHAFDVMLGSQLGIGAFRALVEHQLDGHMVSVSGQLDLQYIPFDELINAQDLVTKVRLIQNDSDFHRLARILESHNEPRQSWVPGRRREP